MVLKIAGIAALGLLLLIPLWLVRSVLVERKERRDGAVAEITASWGGGQTIVGPVLVVPYRVRGTEWKDEVVDGVVKPTEVPTERVARAYVLPERLAVGGALAPVLRRRGIFEAVVYRADLTLEGAFAPAELARLGIPAEDVLWDQAVVTVAIPDLRGARGPLRLIVGGQAAAVEPGARLPGRGAGIHAPLPLPAAGAAIPFELALRLDGSRGLRVAPLGAETTVKLASAWPHPSFQGAFLPDRREVGAGGFAAEWAVSRLARGTPQSWIDDGGGAATEIAALAEASVGVDFLYPVDSYRAVERAIKYGVLFIALIFVTFFVFEIVSELRIHPFQYALVGLAIGLFFLLLLSLSELLPFYAAYVAAAGGCTLLISLYSLSVLRSQRRTVVAAGGLAASFGFLYVVLQLEDYSLIAGSLGLFAALAFLMWATRRVDWYAREAGGYGTSSQT